MKTKLDQIVNVNNIGKCIPADINSIINMAIQEQLPASADDSIKRLLLIIDNSNEFMEGRCMGVPGSLADTERIIHFIYNNICNISCIACSLDAHIPQQIFHSCWWVNPEGIHPDNFTIITYDDVISKRWIPVIGNPDDSINYVKELEKNKKKKLCIWPYHGLLGTSGATIENELTKMIYFHSIARKSEIVLFQKGTDPYSEMYGIIKPEYSKDNFINLPVLKLIEKYDEIYLSGQAASHCFLDSVAQIIEYFESQQRFDIIQKLIVLEDCTSPITGYEAYTTNAFTELKRKYNVKFAKSTDIHF